MNKEDLVYTYNSIFLCHQKKKEKKKRKKKRKEKKRNEKKRNLIIYNDLAGTGGIILSEISQLVKDNNHMISLICAI